MNVTHISPRFFPAISGAEFYMQRISEELFKTKVIGVTLHCSNAVDFAGLRETTPKSLEAKSFLWKNQFMVHRHAVESLDFRVQIEYYLKNFQKILQVNADEISSYIKNGPAIPSMLAFLKESQTNLLHSTFFPYQTVLDGILASILHGIPSVCTPFFHFANPRYKDIAGISLLNKYSKILACTVMEKNELTKCGIFPDKIEVVPMGVDAEKFELAKREWFAESYDIAENRPVVLFCGYKNYEKGALSLLQSLPHVQNIVNDVLYCFIGPPTKAFNYELSRIKKLGFTKNILNINPVNLRGYFDKRKLGAFKSCAVYAMPSRTDAYGISFLEAWAAGKPVIGADIGATPEVIEDGVTGLLTEFGNPLAIAQKIIMLLQNSDLANTLGTNGQNKVRENNSWKTITQKIKEIYEVLVSG